METHNSALLQCWPEYGIVTAYPGKRMIAVNVDIAVTPSRIFLSKFLRGHHVRGNEPIEIIRGKMLCWIMSFPETNTPPTINIRFFLSRVDEIHSPKIIIFAGHGANCRNKAFL